MAPFRSLRKVQGVQPNAKPRYFQVERFCNLQPQVAEDLVKSAVLEADIEATRDATRV